MRRVVFILTLLLMAGLPGAAKSVRELYRAANEAYGRGEYMSAVNAYRQILSQLPASELFAEDRAFYLRPYSNVLLAMGAYEEVDSLLSPEIYADDAVMQINRAAALGYQERFDDALEILNRLAERDLAAGFRGRILQNQGFLLLESGRLEQAAEKFAEAAPYFSGTDRSIVDSNLALCYARMGRFGEANRLIDTALRGLKDNEQDYIRALRKAAEISYLQGRKSEARSRFREFFNRERQWLIANLPSLSVDSRLNLWLSEKGHLAKCFLLEDYAPEFLFDVAMYRRLTSLMGMQNVDRLRELLDLSAADIRRALRPGEAAIEFVSYLDADRTEQYAAIILPAGGPARFVKLFDTETIYEPEMVGTNSIFNAIKRDDPAEKNLLYSDADLADMVWGPIVAALPAGAKSIYFAPEGIFHFWGIENMPFTGRDDYEIRRLTSTASLARRGDKNEAPTAASALIIGGLDYTSLPTDSANYAPNHEAAELIAERIGRNDIFNYLPGTRAEVDSISPAATHSIGEAELKALLPKFDLVHIATHGYSLNLGIRRRPEFLNDSSAIDQSLNAAGIALTGANIACQDPTREDGLLSAREICDLDLSGVDFVILSACQTAQGDITDEGAAGLVRGLKNAGVKTVMASLWSVDDKSTMLFMREFYRLLGQGRSKYEAYVGAQDFLKNYSRQIPQRKFSPATLAPGPAGTFKTVTFNAPYFWAPFILIDDF